MKKADIYKLLEAKMLGYADYMSVPVRASRERLVPISSDSVTTRQLDADMREYTGEQIFVRHSLRIRLEDAAAALKVFDPTLQLEVIYGYRAPEIQQRLFARYKAKLERQYGGEALLAATHRLIAVPEVAGHPAGAAVDIQIIRNGTPLDFGTTIWEFVPDSYVFSPFVSTEAWNNRQLLRRIMLDAGFAPFDGEWWHFSYGDKEWARYYERPYAIYTLNDFRNTEL